MKKLIINLVVLVLFSYSTSSISKSGASLFVPPEILDNPNLNTQGWLVYGKMLAMWSVEYDENGNIDFYKREVYAREGTARLWRMFQEGDLVAPDNYFDELVKVWEAGFMKEYTWHYLKKGGWSSKDKFRMSAFKSWELKNIPLHKPIINPGFVVK